MKNEVKCKSCVHGLLNSNGYICPYHQGPLNAITGCNRYEKQEIEK